MISTGITIPYLNAFFAKGTGPNSSSKPDINIPLASQCWIGVSTTVPELNSSGVITNFTEPASSTGYSRSRLGIFNNTAAQLMDDATTELVDPTKPYDKITNPYVAAISNTNNFIFFDEATPGGGGFGTVVWFGLFSAKAGGVPLVAGELMDLSKTPPVPKSVTVPENSVLLFRKGELKVYME